MRTFFLVFCLLLSNICIYCQSLDWIATLGNTLTDRGHAIAVDAAGNVIATGEFQGKVDFDPDADTFFLTSNPGSTNTYVVKLTKYGEFIWAKRLGIGGGYAIALDGDNNINVVGHYRLTSDFDPGPGIAELTSVNNSEDIFICQLDSGGNFRWVKGMGGPNLDQSTSITVDVDDNIYTTGFFSGTADFDPGLGTDNLVSGGGTDIYLQKLSSAGIHLWAKRFGEAFNDHGADIAIDKMGNPVFTGGFHGMVDFDPSNGTFVLIADDSIDVFVCSMNGAGNFQWAKSFGGTHDVNATDIEVDNAGNILLAGHFKEIADFNPDIGHAHLTSKGGDDIFVNKLNATGGFVWAKQIGGPGNEICNRFLLDLDQKFFFTGVFTLNCDFDPGPGAQIFAGGPAGDIFLLKLDPQANFLQVKQMGGVGTDEGNDVAIDAEDNAYLTGNFMLSADFNPGRDVLLINSHGDRDAFILKMNFRPYISDFEGNLTPCADDTVVYSINAENVNTFSWSFPTGWFVIGNGNNDTIRVIAGSQGGLISVTAAFNGNNTTPLTYSVDPISAPTLATIMGVFSPCPGEMQAYTISSTDADFFTWTFPADWQIVGSANNDSVQTIVGQSPGMVSVTANNACGSASTQRNLTTRRLPVITSLVGDFTPCVGDTLNYRAQNQSVTTFDWMFPAGWQIVGLEDTNVITVVVGLMNGSIIVTGTNICGDTVRESTVNPVDPPEVHVIVNGNVLSLSQSGQSFQWYINNVAIPGASGSSYQATQSGSYHAVVNYISGCTVYSDTVAVTITSIQNASPTPLHIFPNPANDLVHIDGITSEFEYGIYDYLGKKLLSGNASNADIDISELGFGWYLLRIISGGDYYVAKLVIEN